MNRENIQARLREWWQTIKTEISQLAQQIKNEFAPPKAEPAQVATVETEVQADLAFWSAAMDTTNLKQCTNCNQWLPLEFFKRNGQTEDGYTHRCNDCLRYDADGFDKHGYNWRGYDRQGYDRDGFDKHGYDRSGHDRVGLMKPGYVDTSDIPQDRLSYVYFIFAPDVDRVKIGISKQPNRRLQALQRSSPVDLELLGIFPGTEDEESRLHSHFAKYLYRDEWFEVRGELLDWIEERFPQLTG